MDGSESEESTEENAGAEEASEPYVPVAMSELSEEQAHMVLDEIQEFVRDLEPGAAERDAGLYDEMERLLSSLESLEVPVSGGSATPESIASWIRVLAIEGSHDDGGGPEEIRALVDTGIDQLRDLLALGRG